MSDTTHVWNMDNKRKYTIVHVKQEIIKKGLRKDCGKCPVALAVAEHFGRTCSVDNNHIILYMSGAFIQQKLFTMLKNLRDRIRLFDDGYGMEPFKIRLTEFPGIKSTAEVYEGDENNGDTG